MKTTLFRLSMLASFPLAAAVWAANEFKIGVVDYQEVLELTEDGKKAKAELEKLLADRKRDVDTKKRDFEKAKESYEKGRLAMSADALGKKEKELQERAMDLQQFAMKAEGEVGKAEMGLKQDILKKIRAVVEKIGSEGGYSYIAEKNEGGVIFYKDALDITKQVVAEYNKAYKAKK